MRGIISAGLIIAYIGGGAVLFYRASRYLKDPTRPAFGYAIWRPSLYTEAGQGPRLNAARFYLWGAVALIVALWLLAR